MRFSHSRYNKINEHFFNAKWNLSTLLGGSRQFFTVLSFSRILLNYLIQIVSHMIYPVCIFKWGEYAKEIVQLCDERQKSEFCT